MKPTAPDSPRHALQAAMLTAGGIQSLNGVSWARGSTGIGRGRLLPGEKTINDVNAALEAALAPWVGQLAGLFPGLSVESLTIGTQRHLKVSMNPRPFVGRNGFGRAFVRYGALIVRHLLEQPGPRPAAAGVLTLDLMGWNGPRLHILGHPSSPCFGGRGIYDACFKRHAKARADWLHGIEVIQIRLGAPPLSAHRRAVVLREIAERTGGKP